tara:strand:- start:26 stop:145 length:120 start_codon:yes stop_codon:yes gene_type:complete
MIAKFQQNIAIHSTLKSKVVILENTEARREARRVRGVCD